MVALTHVLEFLGVLFDLLNLTISVAPHRLREIRQELKKWCDKAQYTRKQLESLLGKLQFVSNCVCPGRLLVFRLRNALRETGPGWHPVTREMYKDIKWWWTFLPQYNTVSIMWMEQVTTPDTLVATDACLGGLGGQCGSEYFHVGVPEEFRLQQMGIVHLELLTLLVALKKWKHRFRGKRFGVNCDNIAVVQVINNGTAKDLLLQKMLRMSVPWDSLKWWLTTF